VVHRHNHHTSNPKALSNGVRKAFNYTAKEVVQPVFDKVVVPLSRDVGSVVRSEGKLLGSLSSPIVLGLGGALAFLILTRR
jgi:hypothetical protein